MHSRHRQIWRINILLDEVSWSPKTRPLTLPLEEYRETFPLLLSSGAHFSPCMEVLMLLAETGEARLGRSVQKALVELIREHFRMIGNLHAKEAPSEIKLGAPVLIENRFSGRQQGLEGGDVCS